MRPVRTRCAPAFLLAVPCASSCTHVWVIQGGHTNQLCDIVPPLEVRKFRRVIRRPPRVFSTARFYVRAETASQSQIRENPQPLKCYINKPSPVPPGLKLSDIIKTIPEKCFEKSYMKAFVEVLITALSSAAGLLLVKLSPWYLLPVSWFLAGTALTGVFVIGHDCAHNSFTPSKKLNEVIGILTLSTLLYPYDSWRLKHDYHHRHTNKLRVDNAWQPFNVAFYARQSKFNKRIFRLIKGPLWWLASIGHLFTEHYDMRKFSKKEQLRVKFSIACVYTFMATVLLPLLYFTGPLGLLKYYLLPYIGFHFWMSTFTMVHHTLPQIRFVPEEEWEQAQAQLGGTVHCSYPLWVDLLTHNISVHVPHHVSTSIPSYNLPIAWASIRENWGKHVHQCVFSVELIQDITSRCHLYDATENYQTFEKWESTQPAIGSHRRS